MHTHHLWVLLKCRLWFGNARVKFCIFNQLPGDTNAAGPCTRFGVERHCTLYRGSQAERSRKITIIIKNANGNSSDDGRRKVKRDSIKQIVKTIVTLGIRRENIPKLGHWYSKCGLQFDSETFQGVCEVKTISIIILRYWSTCSDGAKAMITQHASWQGHQSVQRL